MAEEELGETSAASESTTVLSDTSQEGRITLDHQIQAIRNTTTFAFKMLALNISMVGAILGAVPVLTSFGVPVESFINSYAVIGTGFLFGSILAAAATHAVASFSAGINPATIRGLIEQEVSEEEFYELLSSGYAAWLGKNQNTIRLQSIFFTACMLLFIDALLFLGAGLVAGIYPPRDWIPFAGLVVVAAAADYGLYVVGFKRSNELEETGD